MGVRRTTPANPSIAQINVLIALSGAGGGAVSGVIMAVTDYGTLALGGGILALLLIPVLLWAHRPQTPIGADVVGNHG